MKITFPANLPFSFVPVRRCLAFCLLLLLSSWSNTLLAQKQKKAGKQPSEYIQISVYHMADASQVETVEQYLQSSLLPALAKGGFKRIGVFKAADNDTARDKRLFLLLPFKTLQQLDKVLAITARTIADSTTVYAYTRSAHNKPSFQRMETILLRAFDGAPIVKAPKLGGNLTERVYELRSYESASEALHKNKVDMFNKGEVALFDRLGFNAVFYGQVIAGSKMPNLMYMTSFDNKTTRDEHWKTFGGDPEWKTMASNPKYQNNVSRIDITFLRPTAYSKL